MIRVRAAEIPGGQASGVWQGAACIPEPQCIPFHLLHNLPRRSRTDPSIRRFPTSVATSSRAHCLTRSFVELRKTTLREGHGCGGVKGGGGTSFW